MSPPVVDVHDLRTYLVTRWGTIKAVDGVSFTVADGETLGLVGESGDRWRRDEPPLAAESGRLVACHLYPALAPAPTR